MTNLEIAPESDMGLSIKVPSASWLYYLSLGMFLTFAVVIIYLVAMVGTRQYSLLAQYIPLILMATIISLVGFLVITVRNAGWRIFVSGAFLLPLMISIGGISIHRTIWREMDARDEDIYYTFKEGERLMQGQNLYERILSSDMRTNDKYATYLPLFYHLANWTQSLGLEHFARWLLFWREIFLIFNIAVGALLFYVPYKKGMIILAIFANLFWLFNRWTLSATISADFDFIPMFFFILGLIFFPYRLWVSGLLIGLSLSLKHFGIFIIPLLLIYMWQTKPFKKVLIYSFSMIVIPCIVSLPFLLSNWKVFILSILFSATRYPFSSLRIDSVDALLGWVGIPAKLLMLGLLGLLYALAVGSKNHLYLLSLLVMSVFVFFNSVFYPDYVMYLVPFIALAASEVLKIWKPEVSLDSASNKLREKYFEWRAR